MFVERKTNWGFARDSMEPDYDTHVMTTEHCAAGLMGAEASSARPLVHECGDARMWQSFKASKNEHPFYDRTSLVAEDCSAR